jgi:hypothetical protein
MAALVLTMTTGPVSQQGLSPQAAEACLTALTVTVACKATPERTYVKNILADLIISFSERQHATYGELLARGS